MKAGDRVRYRFSDNEYTIAMTFVDGRDQLVWLLDCDGSGELRSRQPVYASDLVPVAAKPVAVPRIRLSPELHEHYRATTDAVTRDLIEDVMGAVARLHQRLQANDQLEDS
jgi:hypothetical protein